MQISKVKQLLGVALAVTVFAGAMPLAAQTAPQGAEVRVETTPPGAQVLLNGEVRGSSPVTISDIPSGMHIFSARRSAYITARQSIELRPGERIVINMNLDPVLGLLLVESEPAGAELFINDAARGKTPRLVTDLPVGDYRFTFKAAGYQDRNVDVTVRDRTPQRISSTLVPDTGSLRLASEPTGARIILNGADRGTTPAILERISSGMSTLELQFEGYRPFRQELRITAGEQETLRAVLEPIPASLNVVTIPAGARIYVDNQYRGDSPLLLRDIPPKEYRIRAELEGYDPMARTVALQAAQSRVEEFRLTVNSGSLQITTEPAGVSIFVDGRERGRTSARDDQTDMVSDPLTIPLITPGERSIRLARRGYYTKEVKVEIEREKTAVLHEAMARRFIPDIEVRTASEVYRGVLVERDGEGNFRVETRPGIIRTIPRADVRSVTPLRVEEEQ